MRYLLDAGTLVAMLRGRLPVVLRLSQLRPADVAVPVLARMQVEIALQVKPRSQARYGKLLREFLETVLVLEFGDREADEAVRIGSFLAGGGERIGTSELMLAACAVAHQRTLVVEKSGPYRMVPGLACESWLENP